MKRRCNGSHPNRRTFFTACGAGVLASASAMYGNSSRGAEILAAAGAGALEIAPEPAKAGRAELGIPGPYPGLVVEARHPGMIRQGKRSREAVTAALGRAMKTLTGADEAVDAWRTFLEPDDVVGIKMNPVGYPLAPTSSELLQAVIENVIAAGVPKKNIIVFERYAEQFIEARMHEAVPDGIAWEGLSWNWDYAQTEISGQPAKGDKHPHVGGYDPDQFVMLNVVGNGLDTKDDRNFRSHLGLLITKKVNKIINLPVLKDHGSGGVTGALKNMSHGSVNNVNRSHSTPDTNVCNIFIPNVVNHPIIRKKYVLHIMDGIVGVYQNGPFAYAKDPQWSWENNALLVATDPVAMDHVLWQTIDAKRKAMGLAPVGAVGKLGLDAHREGFDMRHPQHIALAGNLGLGIFDFKSPKGRKHEIQHKVIEIPV